MRCGGAKGSLRATVRSCRQGPPRPRLPHHRRAEQRRSERKRTQTDFLGATETLRGGRRGTAGTSRAAAIAAAYEPLAGLKQLGEVEGGEGRVWVGAEDSPALGGFAPPPADRLRFLELVQRYRDANPVRGGASALPRTAGPSRDPRTAHPHRTLM